MRDLLVDAVGEEATVAVTRWLADIVEHHTLSANGRLSSPSCAWLLDAISENPTPTTVPTLCGGCLEPGCPNCWMTADERTDADPIGPVE